VSDEHEISETKDGERIGYGARILEPFRSTSFAFVTAQYVEPEKPRSVGGSREGYLSDKSDTPPMTMKRMVFFDLNELANLKALVEKGD